MLAKLIAAITLTLFLALIFLVAIGFVNAVYEELPPSPWNTKAIMWQIDLLLAFIALLLCSMLFLAVLAG